eukprot:IDg14766t1
MFHSAREAKDEGYYKRFKIIPRESDRSYFEGGEAHSILDVPCSQISREELMSVDEANNKSLVDLELAHPWLSVELHYFLKVTRKSNDNPHVRIEFEDYSLTLQTTETVSLHTVTCKFFVAAYKVDSYLAILRSSNLSLRAVHVVAIGMRGMLRKCCDKSMTDIEELTLGMLRRSDKARGNGVDDDVQWRNGTSEEKDR